MNKHIITLLLLGSTCFAGDKYETQYVSSGSGITKGDALASAMMFAPSGNVVKNVVMNGYSVNQFVKGVGYIQTYGNYKCTIISSTKNNTK